MGLRDSWTASQIDRIQKLGNAKVNSIFEECLPDRFLRPSSSSPSELEQFIRDKYERKVFVRKELGGRGGGGRGSSRADQDTVAEHNHQPDQGFRVAGKAPQTLSGLAKLQEAGFSAGASALALQQVGGDVEGALFLLRQRGVEAPREATREITSPKSDLLDMDYTSAKKTTASQTSPFSFDFDGAFGSFQSAASENPPRSNPATSTITARLAELYQRSASHAGPAILEETDTDSARDGPESRWWEPELSTNATKGVKQGNDQPREDDLFSDLLPLGKR